MKYILMFDVLTLSFSPTPAELAYESNYSSPVVAVIICICILTILLISMVVYFMFYIRQKKSMLQ